MAGAADVFFGSGSPHTKQDAFHLKIHSTHFLFLWTELILI